jgi:hypothetical protein
MNYFNFVGTHKHNTGFYFCFEYGEDRRQIHVMTNKNFELESCNYGINEMFEYFKEDIKKVIKSERLNYLFGQTSRYTVY